MSLFRMAPSLYSVPKNRGMNAAMTTPTTMAKPKNTEFSDTSK